MFKFFSKMFRSGAVKFEPLVQEVNSLEKEIAALSEEELKEESKKLREKVRKGATLDEITVRAFAVVREAARRTLGQRAYDVQIIGGLVLHQGAVAEMATGEGKTLAAVAPAYLNALAGAGVHIVTVNEYLARRDAVWMGQVYETLGVSVACLVPQGAFLYDPEWSVPEETEAMIDAERDNTGSFLVQQEYLRPITRREAYLADITYGTNHEFGFDYLRDNLAPTLEAQAQRGHPYAIIDEVDSILIDEARTPLIISAPDEESSELYKTFSRVVSRFTKEEDYTVDEKLRSVFISDQGIEKAEQILGVKNIYAPENLRLVHYLEESLKAHALYEKDRDYVVRNDEIVIVDEFTGRMLQGRRYNGGLHQAIEAKEGVMVQKESRTYAKISIQNYFRMYEKLSGMTGTAQTSAEEFYKVYGLEVVSIPTNRPIVRDDMPDLIFKDADAKWRAVAREIRARHEKGQPVLVGTTSISKNEFIDDLLTKERIPHQVLNAKKNEEEGAIIAQAGRVGAVTVATNMAGRGVDIILGGNPPDPEEAKRVRELGGLHVLGTERHDARRIDNQLRGRAGRQGDPGSSQFFLSLDDDLLRIFGGERLKNMMERMHVPEDEPIEAGIVTKAVGQAQSKVEGANFDTRKHLLEYDDVLNRQREIVYRRRGEILGSISEGLLADIIYSATKKHVERTLPEGAYLDGESDRMEDLKKAFEEAGIVTEEYPFPDDPSEEKIFAMLTKRSMEVSMASGTLPRVLGLLDMLWMNHLDNLDALSQSVGLRAYGQRDPLVEYREEARRLFQDFWDTWNEWIFVNIFKSVGHSSAHHAESSAVSRVAKNIVDSGKLKTNAPSTESAGAMLKQKKVGRNDPCPCGSDKKYKKCHGAPGKS